MTKYLVAQKGTTEGNNKILDAWAFVKDGSYFVTIQHLNPKADETTYRNAYFAKLQLLATETGHNKQDMHEIIKQHLILELYKKDSVAKGSLTLEEWVGLLQAIDLWAFQNYEVILP
jgi:hypothetical protein